ncbi:unnamed protein product [Oikopleura dioica]|uniref:Gelsolin-like domain-containing protein n=1 Tax=Oikopleura dioica TaxID=34765 RepID=E4XA90_OIKDI|nr:unnamed protein product [Oikopleura dioica]
MSNILDEKFKDVKKEAGLQIWRIENMEMAVVKEVDYGVFFSGDSYIILKTIEKRAGTERRIHFWLGEESSVDERGAAAIWATHLDDWFGGEPVQYRETQNHESEKFMGLFANGVRYKKGGVAGKFKKINPNENTQKTLYQVKGKRRPRLQEVDIKWDSFNEGDVFILEYKNWLVQWNGKAANRFEKLKACQTLADMAAKTGRPKKIIVEQGRSHEALIECLGPLPDTYEPGTDDVEFEKASASKPPVLYAVNDNKKLGEGKSMKQEMLDTKAAFYVVDNLKIYTWKGKECPKELRKKILVGVDEFLSAIGFKGQPQIEGLSQGTETAPFKQLFASWKVANQTEGIGKTYVENSIATTIKELGENRIIPRCLSSKMKKPGKDNGRGEVEVFRIETGSKSGTEMAKIEREDFGQFFGGDCYIIAYCNHKARPKTEVVYFWLGANSTIDEHTAAAHHTVKLAKEKGGWQQVRVQQGKEPHHLQKIFQNFIIYRGGTSRKGGQTAKLNPTMFHCRSSIHGYTRNVEVAVTAGNLNSNDIFILVKDKNCWLWKGKGSNSAELTAAEEALDLVVDGCTIKQIEEEKESPEFWDAIGGKKEYAKLDDADAIDNAKLFVCSDASGKMQVEEIGEDFTQGDLIPEDVMILDGGAIVYVWLGKKANANERKDGPEIARRYAAGCPGRKKLSIIEDGKEPLAFIGFFQGWDDKYDASAVFESMKNAL